VTDSVEADGAHFFSSPGGVFGPPTLSIPGSIFSEVDGVCPVVSGAGALAFGMAAAGGRSGVVVCGCVPGYELVGAPELSCPLGICFWADATPTLRSSAAAAKITTCVFMRGSSGCEGPKGNVAHVLGFLSGELLCSATPAAQAEAQRCCAA
jgi:hypothetical protein